MQDNANKPTVGLAANIERKKQFAKSVKEWKGFTVTAMRAGENVTFYECVLECVLTNGKPMRLEQVSVAKWRDGKIVHERFYYNRSKDDSSHGPFSLGKHGRGHRFSNRKANHDAKQ